MPKFINAVKKSIEDAAKKMGDPMLQETAFGPLVDKKQFGRFISFLRDGKQEGVQVLVDGVWEIKACLLSQRYY